MTIHSGHPFDTGDRDSARQLRGRIGGATTLWTAGVGADRAGLTVSSLMVALGEPARVVALLDPDADLTLALEETGLAVVQLLSWSDRHLAEMFAGVTPAPGGAFRHGDFADTQHGPVLAGERSWSGVRLEAAQPLGWSVQVTCILEHIAIAADDEPLIARRGRWQRP